MIEAAEAMYNCDMTLAKQADPSTLMSIHLDLEDGKLKVPLLRSSSAWGSLSAISTESERRSGQDGTAVLLTDTVAAEAEVPVRRIAQVLNLIEVVLECLVVAAASSTDGRLVTASAYENAGNHGIVHKGLATGAWRLLRFECLLLFRARADSASCSQRSTCSSPCLLAWLSCVSTSAYQDRWAWTIW